MLRQILFPVDVIPCPNQGPQDHFLPNSILSLIYGSLTSLKSMRAPCVTHKIIPDQKTEELISDMRERLNQGTYIVRAVRDLLEDLLDLKSHADKGFVRLVNHLSCC